MSLKIRKARRLPGIDPLKSGGYKIKGSKGLFNFASSQMFNPFASDRIDRNSFVGLDPPEKKGWTITGYHKFQTNSPSSGSTNHRVPIWSRIKPVVDAPKAQAKAAPAPAAPSQDWTPTPLDGLSSLGNYGAGGPVEAAPPLPKFTPGGNSTTVDNNAMGFRRKKSSARLAGLTTRGTSQFKIAPMTGAPSLNIGTF